MVSRMNASKRTTVSALLLTLSCALTACDPGYGEGEEEAYRSADEGDDDGDEGLFEIDGPSTEDEAVIEREREVEREYRTERELDYGCTYSLRYWQVHNAAADRDAFMKPWPLSEKTQLCGWTWFDIVDTPADDSWSELAQPLIASMLNMANGASVPSEVYELIVKSKSLVGSCKVDAATHDQALELAAVLHDYNDGRLGPGSCH